MKILHTSDWHIGKRLYNKDTYEDHRLFFDWLTGYINTNRIDAMIISGDVFDMAYPSNNALQQYYEALIKIKNTCCRDVIITGGNHDSSSTLNAPREILQHLNIHVIGGAMENKEHMVIPIVSKENDKRECLVCAIPFLRDKDIRSSVPGESYAEKMQALREGLKNYYVSFSEIAKNLSDSKNIPVIATGHLFIQGGKTSESERELYIGNLVNIESNIFPPEFDYIALGHLHRPQKADKEGRIRYSGSPISLSFSERDDQKKVIMIEITDNTGMNLKEVDIPKFRELKQFTGPFEEIQQKINHYQQESELKDRAEIIITEKNYNPGLITEIEKYIEQIEKIEVLNYKILFESQPTSDKEDNETYKSLTELNIRDVFEKMLGYYHVEGNKMLKRTFDELLDTYEQ
jgi:DNA repair protein SbcD/Mre11